MSRNQTLVTVTYYVPLSDRITDEDRGEKSYTVHTDNAGIASILGAMDEVQGQGEDEDAEED